MPRQSTKTNRGTELKWVRTTDINLVPRYLVDQIKNKDWDTDKFYSVMQKAAKASSVFLGVFCDASMIVHGFMVGNVNPITNKLFIYCLSASKEYQNKGILSEAVNICKKFKKDKGLAGIIMNTTRENAMARAGFKKTMTTMEL